MLHILSSPPSALVSSHNKRQSLALKRVYPHDRIQGLWFRIYTNSTSHQQPGFLILSPTQYRNRNKNTFVILAAHDEGSQL